MTGPVRRALQATLLLANIALVTAWLVFGQGESIQPATSEDLRSAVVIILWWSSPALVLFFHQTWGGVLLSGSALLLASSIALLSIYSSTDSTAAIGFYTLPLVGWVLALTLVGAEWVFRRPWPM